MKKVLSLFLAVILLVSFTVSLFSLGYDITAKEIIEKVQERYKKSTTVVAKYSQTVKFKLSKIERMP